VVVVDRWHAEMDDAVEENETSALVAEKTRREERKGNRRVLI
jgi:hypothetical protein